MKRYAIALLLLLAISGLAVAASCFSPPQSGGAVPSPAAKPAEPVTPAPAPQTSPTAQVAPSPPPPSPTKPAVETPPTPPPPKTPTPAATVAPEPEPTPALPLTVTDDLGRKVKIEKLPRRIISLAPSNTEILYALGLGDSIVGVTQYDNYPEEAKSKTRVAGYSTPSLEKVVSLQPDLILAESIHEKLVLPALERLGVPVFATSAESIDGILKDITLIGQITGKSRAAARVVAGMTTRIEAVASKTKGLAPQERPRVLHVVWHDPVWTMGSATYTDDVIQKAGGVNIYASEFQKSRAVSIESVVARNPDVIIVSGMATTQNLVYDTIKNDSRLSQVSAMLKGRIYQIDGDIIERPGPRIVEGLELVARFLQPGIFGKPPGKS